MCQSSWAIRRSIGAAIAFTLWGVFSFSMKLPAFPTQRVDLGLLVKLLWPMLRVGEAFLG